MTKYADMTGKGQRDALRALIRVHSAWKGYRELHNINFADMQKADYVRVYRELYGANEFDIDAPDTGLQSESDSAESDSANAAENTRRDIAESNAKVGTIESATIDGLDDDEKALIERIRAKRSGIDESRVLELIRDNAVSDTRLEEMVKRHIDVRHHVTMTRQDGTEIKIDGLVHETFATLLRCLGARQANGLPPSIWLAGPAGSGKTHAVSEAAKALGVNFYFNGALSMAHELLGFVDASGRYHSTPFRQAYENGGVYLFDEVDGSENQCLLALNAALANGHAAFPDQASPVGRHRDFTCLAAANTFGLGATAEYVGRAKIDAAFLSRFPVKLYWGYDAALEQVMSGNSGFAARVQRARAKAAAAGVKILIDPRHSQAGAALIAAGFTEDQAADMTYLASLSPDQRKIVESR